MQSPFQPGPRCLDVQPGGGQPALRQWHDSSFNDSLSALMQEPPLAGSHTAAPHLEAISPCPGLQLASQPHQQPFAQWGSRESRPSQEATLLQALLQGTPSHAPTGPADPPETIGPQQLQWWQAADAPHSSAQPPVSVPATPAPWQGDGIQRATPWAALLQQWDLRPAGAAADAQQAAWGGWPGGTKTAAAAASLQVQAALQQQGQHAAMLQQLQAAMSQQGAVTLRQQPSHPAWAAPAQPHGLQTFGRQQQQQQLLLPVPSLRVQTPEIAFRDQQHRLLKEIPSLTAPVFTSTPSGGQPLSNSLTWAGHAWHLSGPAHSSHPQSQPQSLTESLRSPDSQRTAPADLPKYGGSALQPGISYAVAAEEAEQSAVALPEAAWHPGMLPGGWHDQ